MAELALRGLTKRFGETTVVDNLSLDIRDGELVCLLGPSGCGKTTTLRIVAGFLKPSAGEVAIGGSAISKAGWALPPERRDMAMVFQSYALWPHMTVAENVAYGLTLRRLARSDIEARTAAMLATVKLSSFADRYPAELSGGQQQRAALARALVVEPKTLLLDEPLSNLDAALREDMRFELRRMHEQTRYTTLYVTHDQAEAMTAADRIVVMNKGRIEQVDTPRTIYEEPRTEFVARFLGGANVLEGDAAGRDVLVVGGRRLVVAAPTLRQGVRAKIAIRHHEIAIANRADGGQGENALPGRIVRSTFLGSSLDLAVDVGGQVLRVAAPPEMTIASDGAIELELPARRCRPLAD
jgi:iron(III) transport system ATP-binding protein